MRHPSFEPRRRKELLDALLARARTWIADWQPRDEGDFATGLFQIAARLESEVTQRLDRVPEKAFRGFLDWLGVTGKPGLAARLPVVFRMTPGSDPVDAPDRVQLQVNTGETPVNFETERPLRILPGTLATIVAADPKRDAFYTPPADVFAAEPPAPVPRSWRLKSEAPVGKTLQLDPPLGLDTGLTLRDPSGRQYDITGAQGGIVTIDPALAAPLNAGDEMTRVDSFTPFGPSERNRQEHSIYIGSAKGLNIEAPALIAVRGGAGIPGDATWWYSGKASPADPVDWQPITKVEIDGGAVVLTKPQGAIETMTIDGYDSRWLKATRAAGVPQSSHIVGGVRLAVNCVAKGQHGPAVTALEGIANTTPLVLDAGFYPFGREPRQFDSFYLGSKEAFSKASAEVTLNFTLGNAVSNARSVVGFSSSDHRSYGIGDDGRLHRSLHGVSSGEPTATFGPPTQPRANQRPIPLNTSVRPSALSYFTIPLVLAAARSEVWMWVESPFGENWTLLETPYTAPDGTTPEVTGVVLAHAAIGLVAYAASGGQLHRRDVSIGGAWTTEAIAPLPPDDRIVMVVPVASIGDLPGSQRETDGIVAVSNQGEMYLRDAAGVWTRVPGGPPAIDTTFYPVVVLTASGDRLCLARDEANKHPFAFDLAQNGVGFWADVELLGHTLDFAARGDEVVAVMLAADTANNQPAAIAVWDAFNNAEPVFDEQPNQPVLVEGPLQVGHAAGIRFFLSAGKDGEAFILPVGQLELVSGASVGEVIVFTDATDWAAVANPIIIDTTPGAPATSDRNVVDVQLVRGTTATHWVMRTSAAIAGGADVRVHASLHPGLLNGTADPGSLTLAAGDAPPANTGLLYVTTAGQQRIVQFNGLAGQVATIPDGLPWPAGTAVQYRRLEPGVDLTVDVRPTVELTGLDSGLAAALGLATLEFESPIEPRIQTVSDVFPADDFAVLRQPWTTAPAQSAVDYLVKLNLFDAWSVFEPPKPRNPTLSWEYFDGTAWRLIPTLEDRTEELATGGDVVFCVPKDIQPTDVVGQKNHWIRARLVGGDYGQETVTVISETVGTKTTQTVERNTDSIRAPYVAKLTVTYKVCCEVVPDVVLTHDNGSLLNQTDVNRSPGAVVDHFVPLREALSASDRALYLGFDTALTGGPIQVLFLVDDGSHDAAFPLRVDALVAGGLRPLVVKDHTRGLNESGTIEMDLAESPQLTELFGTTKYWLRVRPGVRLPNEDDWQPRIRAAYLNATWAIAAETQRFEPLGSSDGSPDQRFVLARPPVIDGSLTLRVLEPLGEEDIDRLRREGVDIQDSFPNVPKRPGCWVLWRQVVDPADEEPGERVYALDDATGVIRFGDGLHGMIPPIGTNTILAEQYQRGGGEAANRVTAWSQINLVTPLSGVNAVFAPDGAAGGSDPQDADTTMRFAPSNLRLRDRALTLADFEMLTLQFSRDIAQARALRTATGMRLIVVMRGRTARPGAGLLRELRTYLLAHSLPSLGGADVLQIEGPGEIPIRVGLELVVDDIAWGGEVARNARQAIERLLDPATGGRDGVGFALGEIPSDADITAALVGIPHLEGIRSAAARRADGSPLGTLKPSQLVRLAPDGVTVDVRLETEVPA